MVNAKLLSKSAPPSISNEYEDGLELQDYAGTDDPHDQPNELDHIDDDTLVAECTKRGMKIQAPGEEDAAGNGTGFPPKKPGPYIPKG